VRAVRGRVARGGGAGRVEDEVDQRAREQEPRAPRGEPRTCPRAEL